LQKIKIVKGQTSLSQRAKFSNDWMAGNAWCFLIKYFRENAYQGSLFTHTIKLFRNQRYSHACKLRKLNSLSAQLRTLYSPNLIRIANTQRPMGIGWIHPFPPSEGLDIGYSNAYILYIQPTGGGPYEIEIVSATNWIESKPFIPRRVRI